ncbi:MAG TPA: ATP-binding protein, partial [Hyphomonadaceae bacterium]
LVTAAIWSAVVLVAAGWSLQALYRAETDRQLDTENNETLLALANAVVSNNGRLTFNDTKLPKDEQFDMAFSGRYWGYLMIDDEELIVDAELSESFADARPEMSGEMISTAISRPGFVLHEDTSGPDERQLRIALRALTFTDRNLPILLYSGIDRTAADDAVRRFALTLGIALGVLALGILVGVLVLIRYGLRPLHEIEDKLHDVQAGRRDTLDGEYPGELSPLVKEINTLISHNRKVVDRARTHVGNLAHALKTPLAVLRNEARGDDRVSEIVRRQTDAMTQNVNHYLKRAQAAAQAEVLGARTEIKEPLEGIARMLERLHRDKGLAIDVDADPRAVFRGEKGDLDELVGNLLENAAKWCKSRIKVKVARSDDGIEVIVDDDGPGLPAEHRAKALERGKRLDESEPGTGLGLSIVTELADIYGGRLFLEDSPLGGLRARLVLPAAPL